MVGRVKATLKRLLCVQLAHKIGSRESRMWVGSEQSARMTLVGFSKFRAQI